MKTGIWGAGNIAHTHAEALLASGITVGAIVDVDSQKAEAFAKEFGIENGGQTRQFCWKMRLQPFMCVHRRICTTRW